MLRAHYGQNFQAMSSAQLSSDHSRFVPDHSLGWRPAVQVGELVCEVPDGSIRMFQVCSQIRNEDSFPYKERFFLK
jgi:hypothetical protein